MLLFDRYLKEENKHNLSAISLEAQEDRGTDLPPALSQTLYSPLSIHSLGGLANYTPLLSSQLKRNAIQRQANQNTILNIDVNIQSFNRTTTQEEHSTLQHGTSSRFNSPSIHPLTHPSTHWLAGG